MLLRARFLSKYKLADRGKYFVKGKIDFKDKYKEGKKWDGKGYDKYKDDWVNLPDEIKKTSGGKDFYYDYNKVVDKKEGKVKYKKLIVKVINYHEYE